jgi:DNA-binding sugar fermentation-stimulating protein
MGLLSEDLVELISSGVDVYVATRDAALEPESMMAMGIRVDAERDVVTVYLPEPGRQATLDNVGNNGEVAVTLVRPSDFRSVQLKGVSLGLRPSGETDKEFQRIFRSALIEQFEIVGVPRSTTRRFTWWPSLALDVRVRDVFGQTPGPRAGERMAPGTPKSQAGE